MAMNVLLEQAIIDLEVLVSMAVADYLIGVITESQKNFVIWDCTQRLMLIRDLRD